MLEIRTHTLILQDQCVQTADMLHRIYFEYWSG